MNRVFKIIKNRKTGLWMVTSEVARSRGGCSTTALAVAAGLLPLLAAGQAQPTVSLQAGQQANAYIAGNGKTTVVNINAPSASGLSHNLYTTYNVNKAGLVLNNANLGMGITAQSTLAGELLTNPNLTQSASTILNEVVSTQRSLLNGFTEVLGSKAAVVVANPNGITCSGCGFINTDYVTLSTGMPMVNNLGALIGMKVKGGDIRMEDTGIDATGNALLNLLSRSVYVTGPINAKALDIRTGAMQYSLDPVTTAVIATAALSGGDASSGSVPTYAIDTAVVGGMYADTIRLIANESGVGVRMLSDVATKSGDFTLTAAGKIEIGGKITSATNIAVTGQSNASGANFTDAALQLNNASLTSVGNTQVQVVGDTQIQGGQLYAGGNSTWILGALKDRTTDALQVGNNQRFAAGNLSVTTQGVSDIAQTNWKSDANLALTGSQLDIGTAGTQFGSTGTSTLTSTVTDINLGQAQLKSAGNLNLDAKRDINVSAGAGQGVQSTAAALDVKALRSLNNAGSIEAITRSTVAVGNLNNTGTLTLSKNGTATDAITTTGNFSNVADANVFSTGTLTVSITGSLQNSGLIQSAKGGRVTAGSFNQNAGGAKLLMNTSADASSAGNSALTVSGTLSNTGLIQAQTDLAVDAGTLTQTNPSARILGAMSGAGTYNLGVLARSAYNNPAVVYSGGNLSLTAPSIVNATTGLWGAGQDVSLAASSGAAQNYGAIYAGRDLSLTASTEINNYITYQTAFERALGVDRSGATVVANKQVLDTKATMDAGRNATFSAPSQFINSSEIRAGGNLSISSNQILNQVQGGGQIVWSGDGSAAQGLDFNHDVQESSSYSFPNLNKTIRTEDTWHRDQYFVKGTPALKPLLAATGTVSLSDFTVGKNLGGVIQGGSVSIIEKTGSTSTFTNDALALQRENYTQITNELIKYVALGPLKYSDDVTTGPPSYVVVPVNFWPVGAPASDNVGATVRATGALTLTVDTLTNLGSVLPNNTYSGSSPTSPVTSGQSTPVSAAAIPGLNLSLPNNPNGYYVTNRNPSAKYLVEANPLFNTGGATVGSDYLMQKLNLDPNTEQKRLGDASYESYLVQQQLIAQTGSSVLNGESNFANVMQGLLDNAVQQANSLGLTYGKAPTPEQLAGLTENIVWMVEVEVDGQKVLAPVVYLAPQTKASIDSGGGMIVASAVTIEVDSLLNQGGTLRGSDSLAVTAKGDITNISGSIGGGNVSLKSTEGSIRNETFSTGSGGGTIYQTTIGKTATIESSGDLALDAKKDITNIGAQMSAGGNASMSAGGNITFDTIQNKTTTTSVGAVSDGGVAGVQSSSTTTVNQVKSGLTVGGNLQAKSGNDITFAGTDVKVGGSADIDAAGNLNIIARENTVESKTTSSVAGMGVGGGVYGTIDSTTESFSSRNVGSTLDIGGNANLSAGQTMTVQGSTLNVGGDTTITATDVQVLAGKDVDRTTTTTTTTSFLQIEDVGGPSGSSSESSSESGSGSESSASAGAGDGSASASAGASANASASAAAGASSAASAGVTLAKSVVNTTSSLSQRSVGSQLNLGGNLTINAKKDVTLQGSEINAQGNVDLQAQNVNLLAAQNIEQSSSTTTTTRLGLYATTENQAGAKAQAGADASANASVSASHQGQSNNVSAEAKAQANSGASADASASSNNTVDVLRIDREENESLKVTNTGSAIRSGGNLNLNVENRLRTQGSTIEAQGDVNLKAKDMSFEAAQDIEYSRQSTSTTRVGVYLDAGASANANAEANAKAEGSAEVGQSGLGGGASGEVSVEGNAGAEAKAQSKIGAGIQVKDTRTTTEQGSSTAVTSAIISRGGSVSRTAEGTIRDVGTNIEAATDFNQSANRIESLAAENSQFSTTTTSEVTARTGVYAAAGAGAEAKASASASAGGGVGRGKLADANAEASASAEADAEAVVGTETKVDIKLTSESSRSTQAVTSNIRVGGNINSRSTQATVLQGTNIEAGGEVNLSASELQVLAARNTEERTSSTDTINVSLTTKMGVGAKAEASAKVSTEDGGSANAEAAAGFRVGASMEAGYSNERSREASTTAVTANISGGRININTSGKTTLEGTNLNAGEGGVNVNAGSLEFKAARDTFEASSSSIDVQTAASVQVTALAGANVDASVSVDTSVASSNESGSNAVVGSINSAGGLNITTRGDMRLEGTQVNVTGDTNIAAGGDIKIDAARNTYEASSSSVSVSAGFDKDKDGGSLNLNVGVAGSNERSSEAVVSNLSTGGSLNISSGGNIKMEGTNLEAGGDAQIAAAGNVTFSEARNESSSSSFSVDVGIGGGSKDSDNQLKETKTTKTEVTGSLGVGVENQNSSQAVTGSIRAGNNLTIASGGNATFVGTDLSAGNSATIAAAGNVDFKAAESTSSGTSIGLGIEGTASSSETRKDGDDDKKGDFKKKDETEASGSFDIALNSSREQKGSNISAGAGGIQISSGGNVNLQGTQMQTDGAADITAAGKVTQTAAVSTSTNFGFGVTAAIKVEEESGKLGEEDDKKDDAKADGSKGDDAKKDDAKKDDAKTDDAKADDAKADDAKADDAKTDDGKPDGKDDDKTADAKDDGDEPEVEKQNSVGIKSLTLESSRNVQATTIAAASGSTIRQGVAPVQPIAGVSMTLRASRQADGSLKALVPIPGNLPPGSQVLATQPDGSPLPDWVKFDAATGTLSGQPPADYTGGANIVISVPKADGTSQKIGVQF